MKGLTPCTRQIRGPLCSIKLDFDIGDLRTLHSVLGKEKRHSNRCVTQLSSIWSYVETNFRFSCSIIFHLTHRHLIPRFTDLPESLSPSSDHVDPFIDFFHSRLFISLTRSLFIRTFVYRMIYLSISFDLQFIRI